MRIGCLQFNPQVGDVDNNLSRADSVLLKANPDDLDLLVLPEMAFTGYNFKSLREISPFLEPSGSGISALWARTTALKYNCNVIVGYPEKVDCAKKWPTSPEYYNSAIVINPEGETVANYRKTHLYYTDETWALESPHGFYRGFIPCLGQTSIGICMDINPYKFQSPWDAFEFGYHILHSESNLVIVTMAWLTNKDRTRFSSMPYDPDLESLAYWATRLEPVIRAEDDEEVIVVFCNRCGSEDDVLYAGTSAVIGIKGGEVSVYGVLGRGEKELLVVDTEQPAFAKMVLQQKEDYSVTSPVGSATTAAAAAAASAVEVHTASPKEIPEETLEEVMRASTPPAAAFASAPDGDDVSAPRRSRPSPPKLRIPQNGGGLWRKEEPDAKPAVSDGTPAVAATAAAFEAQLADWLSNQARVAAAHPKPATAAKPNPDSGVDMSPGSYLGLGIGRTSTAPSSVRNHSVSPSRSTNPSSLRHYRSASRGSDGRSVGGATTARSERRLPATALPPVAFSAEVDSLRGAWRAERRLQNFKDSPRCRQPDQVILDHFLNALEQAQSPVRDVDAFPSSSLPPPPRRMGGSSDDIRTVTLDVPDCIMIGASPSVLATSFPPIEPDGGSRSDSNNS